MWTRRVDCKEIIEENWNESMEPSTPEGIATKIKQCAFALTNWSNSAFGHTTKKIKEKKKVLNNLIVQDREGRSGAEINQPRLEINELLDKEEIRGCRDQESNG